MCILQRKSLSTLFNCEIMCDPPIDSKQREWVLVHYRIPYTKTKLTNENHDQRWLVISMTTSIHSCFFPCCRQMTMLLCSSMRGNTLLVQCTFNPVIQKFGLHEIMTQQPASRCPKWPICLLESDKFRYFSIPSWVRESMGKSNTLPAANGNLRRKGNSFSANETPFSLTLESPQKITSYPLVTSLIINGFHA